MLKHDAVEMAVFVDQHTANTDTRDVGTRMDRGGERGALVEAGEFDRSQYAVFVRAALQYVPTFGVTGIDCHDLVGLGREDGPCVCKWFAIKIRKIR